MYWCLWLTPCRWATQNCVIAIPCVVDCSRISTFSYTMSCTCVCQLVWLTFYFKVIDSLMQDVGSQVTNKQTNPDPIFRTIRLQQRDHSFKYSLCFPLVAIMAVHRNVLKEDDILLELYSDTHSDVSDYSDNESIDSDSDCQCCPH
jgi:hypothetical protein